MQKSTIWLYDQEPFFPHAADRLYQNFLDNLDPNLHYIVEEISCAQKIGLYYPSTTFPIWCTSDQSGPELDDLENNYFILCHYWYHAFISRDWYRYYQYRGPLDIMNKKNSRYRFLMYCRDTTGSRNYRNQIKTLLQDYKSQILHDWESKKYISSDASAIIDFNDAQSSDIHLVLETLFETEKCYLTEKVFKPIVMNQPFIIWGPPGSLEYMRRYGFHTFDMIWSEEYDLEKDHDKRMKMLIDLVKDISAMDPEKYKNLLEKCLPIIEHNRSWFYSEKFMKYCWKELMDNFTQAFETQKKMTESNPGGQLFRLFDEHPDLLLFPARRAMAKQYLNTLDQTQLQNLLRKYPKFNEL